MCGVMCGMFSCASFCVRWMPFTQYNSFSIFEFAHVCLLTVFISKRRSFTFCLLLLPSLPLLFFGCFQRTILFRVYKYISYGCWVHHLSIYFHLFIIRIDFLFFMWQLFSPEAQQFAKYHCITRITCNHGRIVDLQNMRVEQCI